MYEMVQRQEKKPEQRQHISRQGVIQRRGYTSDELLPVIKANWERIVEEKQDPDELCMRVDYRPDWVFVVLRALHILSSSDYYNDNPGDEEQDTAYKAKRSNQYLNPTTLRKNMGTIGIGGEAHHIIPSSVAVKLKKKGIGDASIYNQAWNGVMLNGTIKDGSVINFLQWMAVTALHRRNGRRNHPQYNQYVLRTLEGVKNVAQVQKIATSYLRPKIDQLAGRTLDDIS